MSTFSRASLLASTCALVLGLAGRAVADANPGTAFFYGASVPRELSVAYDQIVLEPAHGHDTAQLKRHGAKLIAYLSVGEVAKTSRDAAAIDPSWILGKNDAWASHVLDVRNIAYRAHLIARFEALLDAGYDGVFLDTLDSYQLVAKTDAERAANQRALCALIEAFAAKRPAARIILNRGFELLPSIAKRVHGVVAESLFDRYDAGKQAYARVPENDRAWLLGKLREASATYRLPVIVIDYRPPSERDDARATARKIAALGFTPYVADGALMTAGVGAVEILPRRTLLLTREPDSTIAASDGAPSPSDAERFIAPVLEHLGYVPERVELDVRGFARLKAESPLTGKYAGIVSWLASEAPAGYAEWVAEQAAAGVPWIAIGSLGFDPNGKIALALGVRAVEAATPGADAIAARDGLIGFEAEPSRASTDSAALAFDPATTRAHLVVRDRLGRAGTVIATTRFGGVLLSHAFATRGLTGERAWVVDPFRFFESALRLPIAPQPDLTTEQGRRVGIFVVRASGLGERARLRGRPQVARVLERELLAQYPFAHALELASDDGTLAKNDARAASALQARWKGPQPLELLDAGALEPGETDIASERPSLTAVFPMALERAGRLHVVAPTAPDARYVGGAAESYPYARVVETFERTGSPRRLTPIALHYHAYAAASPGGLAALQHIYAWADQHQILALMPAEHSARVTAFREQVLLRHLSGAFQLNGGAVLATVRVPAALGALDPTRSRGVASEHSLPEGRYVGFSPDGPRWLAFLAQQEALAP
jgi:hypothetical protein